MDSKPKRLIKYITWLNEAEQARSIKEPEAPFPGASFIAQLEADEYLLIEKAN